MHEQREVWGILGGMGPIASAEFLKSIYQETISGAEQDAPVVILLSDPTIPDRTSHLLNGHHQVLTERLASSVDRLLAAGATQVVICCITIHILLPNLPPRLREKIVSLPDLLLEAVIDRPARHLMLCTSGTRKLQLFEQHPLWPPARQNIVIPEEGDQQLVHEALYEIKGQQPIVPGIELVERLMRKYSASSYIAGCTEVHVLAKAHEQACGRDRHEFCIDALDELLALMRGSRARGAALSPAL